MNPLSTGSEMKFEKKPRRSRPATSGDARRDRERDRQRDELLAALRCELRDDRRGQRGCGRHRADDEMTRAPEGGIEDQRRRGGIQADDG
jgi:hypothetical protein